MAELNTPADANSILQTKPLIQVKIQMDRPLTETANDYFNYLGRYFPQQCANDEFYFLPRSERAIEHLDRLDDLTAERIQDHIKYAGGLLDNVNKPFSNYLPPKLTDH